MYIAIEGIDNSGKTTLIRKLKENLDAEFVKEPTPALSSFIERVKKLDHPDENNILINLFAADRLLLKPIINLAKKEGKHIISDRSKFSSFAYQGQDSFAYNGVVNNNMPDPDLIFYLKISPEESAKRGFTPGDKFENLEFLTRVKEIFEGPIKQYCLRNDIQFIEIDAMRDEDEIFSEVMNVMGGLEC